MDRRDRRAPLNGEAPVVFRDRLWGLRTESATPRSASNDGFEMLDLNDDTVEHCVSFLRRSGLRRRCCAPLAGPGHSTKFIRLSKQIDTIEKVDLRAELQPILAEIGQEARRYAPR